LIARRLAAIGVAAVVVGGGLVVASVAASAATPKLTLSWTGFPAPLTKGQGLFASGTGFAPNATGTVVECNMTSGEPTMTVTGFNTPLPVGCSTATPSGGTTGTGQLFTTNFTALTGVIGPPAQGTDSAGNSATTDANNYPCPPFDGTTGQTCAIGWVDNKGGFVFDTVTFSPPTTPTTTPSTTAPCTPHATTVTGQNIKTGGTPSGTADPATCLVGNQVVKVTGMGLVPNNLGSLVECNGTGSGFFAGTSGTTLSSIVAGTLMVKSLNGAPPTTGTLTVTASGGSATIGYTSVSVQASAMTATYSGLTLKTGTASWTLTTGATATAQPSVSYLGNTIPVACSAIHVFSTTSSGMVDPMNQSFSIIAGTTGPPCGPHLAQPCDQPADSYGNDPTTDAPNFPCPPTPAQVAAGAFCVLAIGDAAGDIVSIPISFNVGAPPLPPTTTTTVASSSSTVAPVVRTGQSTVTGSGRSLAFTGTGPHLFWVALVGVALMLLGVTVLVLVDGPRRLAFAAFARLGRRRRRL
jgi:hypothetical protein